MESFVAVRADKNFGPSKKAEARTKQNEAELVPHLPEMPAS